MQGKIEEKKDASNQIGGLMHLLPAESQTYYLDLLASSNPVDIDSFHEEILEVINYEISVIALQAGKDLSFENLQHLQLGVTIETQDIWRKWISGRTESFSALLSTRQKKLKAATENNEESASIHAAEEKNATTQTSLVELNPIKLPEQRYSGMTRLLLSALFVLMITFISIGVFMTIPTGILPTMFISLCSFAALGFTVGVNGFIDMINKGEVTLTDALCLGSGTMLMCVAIGAILGTFFLPGLGTLSGASVGAFIGAGLGIVFASTIGCVTSLVMQSSNGDSGTGAESEDNLQTTSQSQMTGLGKPGQANNQYVSIANLILIGTSSKLFPGTSTTSEKEREDVYVNSSAYSSNSSI